MPHNSADRPNRPDRSSRPGRPSRSNRPNRRRSRVHRRKANGKIKYFALFGIVVFAGLLICVLSRTKSDKEDFLFYDSELNKIVVAGNMLAINGKDIKFSHDDALLEYYFAFKNGENISDYDFKVDNDTIEWIKLDKEKGVIVVKAKRPLVFEASLDAQINTVYLTPTELSEKYDKIVALDAGHGGDDEGAVVNGIKEKDINRAVVEKVYELLEKSDTGIKPYLIRTGDETVHLSERPLIGNEFADLFVSVHCNVYEYSDEPNGTQTHYDQFGSANTGRTSLTNAELAEIMQRNVLAQLRSRDRGLFGDDELFVLTESTMPAVLIELGYLTNPEEFAKLTDEAYQDLAAKGIYDGIVEAFGE